MPVRLSLLVVLLALTLAAPARADDFAWPVAYTSQAKNPADSLAGLPLEEPVYDPATHCSKKPRPGMTALVQWLGTHAGGAFWGTYRCEKWGPHSASLHAEGRAVDWALDVDVPAQRKEAQRLIALFLAPDRLGQPQALARRMGVEEIIWDCSYWGAGMQDFVPYRACENKHGAIRKHVDPTTAHRNHIHFGLSKAGAMRRTSYWQHA
jgi:hypothetical protein